ncbi:MAG TPA: hypothetical protein VNU68_34745 [Verrucomicrobiae bacterium]|nr:hypothetical protein [Verrucomicrobiae bacterium]
MSTATEQQPWDVAADAIHSELSELKGSWIHSEQSFLPANVECDYAGRMKFQQLLQKHIRSAAEAHAATLTQENSELREANAAANKLIGETAEEARKVNEALTQENQRLLEEYNKVRREIRARQIYAEAQDAQLQSAHAALRAARPWVEEDIQFRQKGGYRVDNAVAVLAQIDAALEGKEGNA